VVVTDALLVQPVVERTVRAGQNQAHALIPRRLRSRTLEGSWRR
jgi:hypothetical protein